jgi:capsular polysaccharide biosynthesis protein
MPQLTILIRPRTRVLLNIGEIVEVAKKVGFQVNLLKPLRETELKRVFWMLDKSDVLMGVHGAALTHFLFMRPGSVFIQIIPLGTDWAAFTYYGEPATKLGLQYLPYKIEAAESSLSSKYNSTDPILTNPASIVEKGWWEMKKIYLKAQDVQPSLIRMKKLLQKAKSLIHP